MKIEEIRVEHEGVIAWYRSENDAVQLSSNGGPFFCTKLEILLALCGALAIMNGRAVGNSPTPNGSPAKEGDGHEQGKEQSG